MSNAKTKLKAVNEFRDAKHVYNTLIKLLHEQAKAHPETKLRLTYKYGVQEFIVEIN